MKKIFVVFLVLGFIFLCGCKKQQNQTGDSELKGKITISGAWALYPMIVNWAEEFQKLHPQTTFDISAGGAGKGMVDALSNAVDLGMVSRDINPAEIEKGAWWVSVVKDAVVPTLNENNPILNILQRRGLTREEFKNIWITGKIKNWSEFSGGKEDYPIHVYTRSDACGAASTWANYLGYEQEDLLNIGVYGDPGLAEAVRADKLGIGFNNINYAFDRETKLPVKGLRILPIDLNENGLINEDEMFYSTLTEITGAIQSGKYPSPPARNLHLVSHGMPKNPVVIEFLRWALTDGQKYVPGAGYIVLPQEKLSEQLKKMEAEHP